jgi:hypothetical protein
LLKKLEPILIRKKAPGFDLVTGEILKHLKRKALVKLTTLFNACIRLKHVPDAWKIAEIIMIPKPGKNLSELKSYRPVSLLSIMSKLCEKLILKRLKPIISERHLVPTHQFGIRNNHTTIDQIHRITDVIEKPLESKRLCSAVFLDVAQAFDRVWHNALLHKLRSALPDYYYRLLESCLTNRRFRVKHEDSYSELKFINADIPHGSVLGPVLYLHHINDLPRTLYSTTATFADDTAVMAVGESNENSTKKLQSALNKIAIWTKKWRIKLNESNRYISTLQIRGYTATNLPHWHTKPICQYSKMSPYDSRQ